MSLPAKLKPETETDLFTGNNFCTVWTTVLEAKVTTTNYQVKAGLKGTRYKFPPKVGSSPFTFGERSRVCVLQTLVNSPKLLSLRGCLCYGFNCFIVVASYFCWTYICQRQKVQRRNGAIRQPMRSVQSRHLSASK